MSLLDKIAIVTGGGSGIGEAVSQELARRGATVVVADIDSDASRVAEAIRRSGGRAEARQVDVSSEDAVRQMVEETAASHGRLDYLFNNAGIGIGGDARDLTSKHWRRAAARTVQRPLQHQQARRRRAVPVSSGEVSASWLAGRVPFSRQAVSKHLVVLEQAGLISRRKRDRHEGRHEGEKQ
jgi:NAD(P)-dependent dehydrogenase (short-subunit alcohol dehydrogenase family)